MSSLSELYQKYAADVFRFALYLSGNHSDAEDITSETFIRLWGSPEPVRMATVKGYLFTIARNLYLQGLRKKRRHVELPDGLPDPQGSPHAKAEQREEFRAMLAALQKLPEMDRTALLMRALDELPYEEIARVLGISTGTVRMRIYRARLALTHVRNLTPDLDGKEEQP
jgi:RNA polymerase sigma-70 factor (ECF subfamily)